MGLIEKIMVSEQTLQHLARAAREHGRTVEQEAAMRLEEHREPMSRDDLIAGMQTLRASLPDQKTDSLTLLREDRDR